MVIVIVAVAVAVIVIVVVAVDEETAGIIISLLGAAFASSAKIINIMKRNFKLWKVRALLAQTMQSFRTFMIMDVSDRIATEIEKSDKYNDLSLEDQRMFIADFIMDELNNYSDDAMKAVFNAFYNSIKDSQDEKK